MYRCNLALRGHSLVTIINRHQVQLYSCMGNGATASIAESDAGLKAVLSDARAGGPRSIATARLPIL